MINLWEFIMITAQSQERNQPHSSAMACTSTTNSPGFTSSPPDLSTPAVLIRQFSQSVF